jgi:hypothetical protein
MSEAGDRAAIVRKALEAAVTGDEAAVEWVYTDDVAGWSPVATVASREALAADTRGRKGRSPTSTWRWTRSTRSATR